MSAPATLVEPSSKPRPTLDRRAYERFLPLIRRAAMRLVRKLPDHITIGDLIGYGWVGLMEAYQRAQPDMPVEPWRQVGLAVRLVDVGHGFSLSGGVSGRVGSSC